MATKAKATTDTHYIALYPYTWGKGFTAEQARSSARKAGGKGTNWVVFKLPPGVVSSYVDDLGGINYRLHPDYDPDECPRAEVVEKGRTYKG